MVEKFKSSLEKTSKGSRGDNKGEAETWKLENGAVDEKILPVISANKGFCGHQALSLCSHPQWCILRGLRMGKSRMLALDSQGAEQRNDSNEPRHLQLPIHRKA